MLKNQSPEGQIKEALKIVIKIVSEMKVQISSRNNHGAVQEYFCQKHLDYYQRNNK